MQNYLHGNDFKFFLTEFLLHSTKLVYILQACFEQDLHLFLNLVQTTNRVLDDLEFA